MLTRTFPRLLLLGLLLLLIAAPATAQTGCPAPQRYEVGGFVTILGGVYIRANPDINAGIISYAPDRIAARLLGGPVCEDGYNWWQVERQYEEPTFLGWVAEGEGGRLYVLPPASTPPKPCPTPLALQRGQAIATYDGVLLRELPSLQGRVITSAAPDSSALVVDGSVCIEGYNWWLVDMDVSGQTFRGWIVEGVPSGAVIETPIIDPAPDAKNDPNSIPCGPPAPLLVGARGRLRFSGEPLKNLRTAPTTTGTVIAQLPSGVQVEILSGAFCNQGVNWRQVRVYGGSISPVGWLAEGDHLGRFIGPNGEDYDEPAP